jgi:hypothetical protein
MWNIGPIQIQAICICIEIYMEQIPKVGQVEEIKGGEKEEQKNSK